MKAFIILCLFAFTAMQASAQTDSVYTYYGSDSSFFTVNDTIYPTTVDQRFYHIFQNLDTEYMNTNVLIDRTLSAIDYRVHIGDTSVDSACNYKTVAGLICAMNGGAKDTSLRPFDSIGYYNGIINSNIALSYTPIMIMAAKFNKLDSMAVPNNLISVSGGQLFDVIPRAFSPYLNEFIFAAAPVTLNFTTNSGDIDFIIPSSLVISNFGESPSSISIDFGDGSGAHTEPLDAPIHIHFPPPAPGAAAAFPGTISAVYPIGTKKSYFIIKIKTPSAYQYGSGQTITWNIAASAGRHEGGTVTVALGCGNTKLMKPLIVVKGFDPQNTYHYQDFIFDLKNYQLGELNNQIDNGGYDIVFVDYNNGLDYIESNARLLEDVINKVNTTLTANGATEKPIVVGISMGGLVAQWCLKTMENQHALNPSDSVHNVKTYISFDSPHRGAYVPLAAEYLVTHLHNIHLPFQKQILNYLNSNSDFQFNQSDIDLPYNILTSPAASEMLIFKTANIYTNPNISLTSSIDSDNHALPTFLNNLKALGYPTQCRNVAIANGSQVVETQGVSPLTSIMSYYLSLKAPLFWFNLNFYMNTLPTAGMGTQVIYNLAVVYSIAGIQGTVTNLQISVSNSSPYEDAPGGEYDITQFVTGLPSQITSLLNVTKFCFVPTVSSLDLANPYYRSPFYDVYSNNILSSPVKTQFKRYVAPTVTFGVVNEEHTDFTNTNYPLFVSELNIGGGHINSPDTGFIFMDTSYNFGANTSTPYQTGDRIGNTEFTSGTSLLINADSALGLSTSGNPHPTHGSNFYVYTSGSNCGGYVTVNIDAGGRMIMGNSTYGNTGTFYVDSDDVLEIDGSLIMNPGCHIVVRKGGYLGIGTGVTPSPPSVTLGANCSIKVEDGGLLDYNEGTINLNDTSAIIEIQGSGQLYVENGDTFKLNNAGGGYVRFNTPSDAYRNLAGGGGAFVLKGSSSGHKVLEVVGGGSLYPGDGSSSPNTIGLFKVTTGEILLGSNSRLNIGCPLTLSKVKITSNTGSNNSHRGLNIYGQSAISIDSVNISYGTYGIYAPLYYGGSAVTFGKLDISNCTTAVYTDGEGATFDTCTFTDNGSAWNGDNMNAGDFEQSKITYSGGSPTNSGIAVNGTSGSADITINQSKITNLALGADGDNCNLIVDTVKINNNTVCVKGEDGGYVSMSTYFDGGVADVSGGTNSVVLAGATFLFMDGGYNKLQPAFGGKSLVTALNYCPSIPVNYGHNYWNGTGGPVSGSYTTSSTCTPSAYSINDPTPLTSYSTYSGFYNGPTSVDPTQLTNPTFAPFNIPDENLKEQINEGMLAAQWGQYPKEASIFNKCVNDYINEGHSDQELMLLIYDKMIDGVSRSIKNSYVKPTGPLVDSVANTLELIQNKFTDKNDYYLRFASALDLTGVRRSQNNRSEALQILENTESWVEPYRLQHVQYLHCVISAEQKVLSGIIPKEQFQSEVKNCIRDNPASMEYINQVISSSETNPSIAPAVYPNPASNSFNVSINSRINSSVNATLSDVNGRVVYSAFDLPIGEGDNVLNFSTERLHPGIYFIHLTYSGQDYREKVVIQNF